MLLKAHFSTLLLLLDRIYDGFQLLARAPMDSAQIVLYFTLLTDKVIVPLKLQ